VTRARIALAIGIAVTALAATPCADAATADEVRAEALFRDGMQKFDAGLVAAACAAFTESLRLDPKLGTLLNLALCHEKQGKVATAWLEYNTGAAWATQNGQKERREFANGHALTLEGQLSRVLLQLPPARELSSVEVDGEPLPEPRWYLPMYLDAGEHVIAVSAPGKQRRTVKVVVPREPSAQLIPIPTLLDTPTDPGPPKTKTPSAAGAREAGSTQRAAGLVVGGIGIAGIAAGAVFGILTVNKRDDAAAHCAGSACDAQGVQSHDDAQSLGLVSTLGFGLGAAALVTGAVLYFTAPRGGVQATLGPRGATVGGVF
jgi:hypothetical protein